MSAETFSEGEQNRQRRLMEGINEFLDRKILPWPVRFLTFRFVILATIALLIPLIVFSTSTNLVLLINSYLNTMGVAVSSIVLLYATISEVRQKQIAEMQEKRAQEDHEHVTAMHTLLLQTMQNQWEEIEELKRLLWAMNGKTYEPAEKEAMPDLHAMHPRGKARYQADDQNRRFQKQLHHNALVSKVREGMVSTPGEEPGG